MGSEVVRAVLAEADLELVGAVDPGRAGEAVGEGTSLTYAADLAAAIDASTPQVMVDFTHPSAVADNIAVALTKGVHCVVGTTGVATEELERLAAAATDGACLFMAPNFAIGAVLMMGFAQQTARYMPHVEIIELHHDRKADAPSGTALRTASLIAGARAGVPDAPGRETEIAEGARGAFVNDIFIHSVRLPGLVAHEEVLFGGQGQTLSIRHDSIDRTSFMPGVVLAIRNVVDHSGLIVGLERFMEE